MKIIRQATQLVVLLVFASATAWATVEEGVAALQRNDYQAAVKLLLAAEQAGDRRALHPLGHIYTAGDPAMRDIARGYEYFAKAANAGHMGSMNILAWAYLRGTPLAKDTLKARAWAERSAKAGDAGGMFLYFLSVTAGPELSVNRSGGRDDNEKYMALARRPAAERELDRKAYTYVALAAEQGNAESLFGVAMLLLDQSGVAITERALQAIERAPQNYGTLLAPQKAALQEKQKLGESYTNLTTMRDALALALPLAMFQSRQISGVECSSAANSKLTKTSISEPISNAEYLEIPGPLLANAILLKGSWKEVWDIQVCGVAVPVTMSFQADGMGGAFFQARYVGIERNNAAAGNPK